VGHTFTHFHLEMMVLVDRYAAGAAAGGLWVCPDRLGEHALPTLMKKIAGLARTKGRSAGEDRRYSS
jgi:A/G-specific adenine glycosylase